ncbi:FxsB family cyclophane-forming radical SAM/SPASM peptide maturase [Streptacidiphilus jiangxiensis]|uniref:Radical SAM core domain-containing protein n=1 Tax=Streptacidiphilus jiangxiensis TaxID=235985 RepID=A0A1H7G2Y5_STRJI|nr:FxsB family cyclophane-forming radical SAM/SPASM peptide maturase [Streptacidiphilus jiangxiensis]SEK32414.1 uncharacterized protein SAMN05414137_101511 [Streptacidiphilus jiangxiensis]
MSAAPWPLTELDPGAVRASGVAPVPLRQFVLKLRSRCNLACDYCYVYTMADQGWRRQPRAMSRRTLRQIAHRIGEHARAHGLDRVHVIFHGGEPLLAGAAPLLDAVAEIRRALPRPCALAAGVQTNGVLLSRPLLDDLARTGVTVGVSLDGGDEQGNRHRLRPDGRPSWPAVERGLRLLQGYPEIYAGLLATVDLTQPPIRVYESLLPFRPPSLDLLLPHGNWTTPPPGLRPAPVRAAPVTPYADWLGAVFEHWWHAGRGEVSIRLFEEAVALLLGLPGQTELLGTSPAALVVLATDGAIEQVDSLRSAYADAAATGLDVFRHSFDRALDHPGLLARQLGAAALADACRACPAGRVCGGGQYPHRYRAGAGFHEPSVYCSDLYALLARIATALRGAA